MKRRSLIALLAGLAPLAPHVTEAQPATPVSLVIATGAGGGYDLYGRLAAHHLGRFLPGQPAVIPRNMPGGGSIVAANWLYNSAPRDGSAIAILQNGTAFAPLLGVTQAQYKGDTFTWLASLNRLVNIGLVWHETPFRNTQDLFDREIVLGSSGGNTSTMPSILNSLLGTKFKVVAGYKSTNDVTLAMERREVDGLLGTSWDSFKATKSDWVRDRKARVLLQVSFNSHPELEGVATLSGLVKREEDRQVLDIVLSRQTFGRPFAAPPGLPKEIAARLQDAFLQMGVDKDFLADAERRTAEIIVNSGEEIKELVDRVYRTSPVVIERTIVELKKAGE